MDEQEKYLRDLEADTEAHVRKTQQRIRELERLRTETAAAFSQNRHKIETVMRDFDRMAQAQGYAGAFDDGTRGPQHENAPARRRYVDPASGRTYWYDATTGRSYWDDATTSAPLNDPAAPAPAPAAAPVPAAAVLAAINPDKYDIRL